MCVCVRMLTFPVKIPVIQRHNAPRWLSVSKGGGGGGGGVGSHVSSCHSPHPARPACVSHTLPPDAEEDVCV